jgi:hypothetical protein
MYYENLHHDIQKVTSRVKFLQLSQPLGAEDIFNPFVHALHYFTNAHEDICWLFCVLHLPNR